MNKKLIFILSVILIVIVGAFVFNKFSKNLPMQNGKIMVATSFYPMYFFAKTIGGDKTDVFNITPAAAEPHDYEPTTQDIVRINQSQMLILNGGKLEAWGEKIKDQLQGSNILIVTAGDSLANKQITENGQKIVDPHVWLDPILAKAEVSRIEKGFEKIDSKDAAYFKSNAKKLQDQLDNINKEYQQGLSSCQKKVFVTSHAAFGYLAAQYGLTQVPISGVSPDQEPSAQKLAQITDLVKKQNIKIIFFESLVSPKLSQTISSETGAKTMVLDPIEGISDNGLKAGQNYLTEMKNNLSALQTALECK